MMRCIRGGVVLLVIALAPFAFGQTKSNTRASVEEELKKLDYKWLDAEKNGDIHYCEKFFADSYVLVLAGGQMYTKDQWLGVLKAADHPTFEVLNPDDVKVHLFGNVAILTDHTTLRGHDSKGNRIDGEFEVFRVVTRQNRQWRATGVVMNPLASK